MASRSSRRSDKRKPLSLRPQTNRRSQSRKRKLTPPPPVGTPTTKPGILVKPKSIDYKVYYRGQDVTPKPLQHQSSIFLRERQKHLASTPDTSSSKYDFSRHLLQRSSSIGRFKFDTHAIDRRSANVGFEDMFYFQSIDLDESIESSRTGEERSVIGRRPSAPKPVPGKVSLVFNETETFFILDITSSSQIKDTEEGDLAEKANEQYDYITIGKGKNRKVVDAMVQTRRTLTKTRETEATKIKRAHCSTFASNWLMYDSFKEENLKNRKCSDGEDEEAEEDCLHGLNDTVSIDSFRFSTEEKYLSKLMKNEKFLQALMVIERLLANNIFNVQQKRFKGAISADIFRENIEFTYELDLLWTFANDKTQDKSVTAVCWNPANEDILVCAYGRFFFTDKTNGLVLVWNIKNPVQPERCYYFSESVSAIAFSKVQPNLIAVGLNNGLIEVIDIKQRKLTVVHNSGRDEESSFETVNYLTFYSGDEHYNYEEQILACFNDGRICKYRLNLLTEMPCIQIMRAPEADGKIKGITKMISCGIPAIPLTKYTGVLHLEFHPEDPNIYYICTNTGVIHKCSTNYFNQHLDLLLAHDGPVYQMQFSPFCNKLYVTCGGDWYVRIWAEGITEPLLELVTTMHPVEYVLWSPTHSTILVAIQNNQIHIWDLHRKVHYPQNTIKSPNGARNSTISFTENGKCLTVCDIEGSTHIFSLENMPFPPFFQDHLLYTAIKRSLITKPDLLKKFVALKAKTVSVDNEPPA